VTHLVSEPELFFAELHASTKTLCHTEAFIIKLTCELKTNSTEPRTARRVDTDTGSQLTDDRPKVAGLEATTGGKRAWSASVRNPYRREGGMCGYVLSVHWIAHPCDRVSGAFHPFDVS
jgi:hypothetical protein